MWIGSLKLKKKQNIEPDFIEGIKNIFCSNFCNWWKESLNLNVNNGVTVRLIVQILRIQITKRTIQRTE